jgi:RNA polymerase sigma-70 factor (ECF subfamily)
VDCSVARKSEFGPTLIPTGDCINDSAVTPLRHSRGPNTKTAEGSTMSFTTVLDCNHADQKALRYATQPQAGVMPSTLDEFTNQIVALRPILERMSRQRLHNETWAEDAVSETLVAALEKPGAFAGRAMLQTWLVGILKHKVVDQIRRHTRERQVEIFEDESQLEALSNATAEGAGEAPTKWNDPQECLSQRQFMAHFDQCLTALPRREARAFMLHHWMEKDTADICNELSVSTNNLYVILHRARRRLRVALGAQWAPDVRTGAIPYQLID